MRLAPEIEKNMIIIVVMILVISIILSFMFPVGILRYIFGHIALLDIVFIVFGVPILALWPDSKEDWEYIKRKFKKK